MMGSRMENGRVVMTTLKRIGHPATARDVARKIDEIAKVGIRALMPTVKATLAGGITHGYIQRRKGRYYIQAIDPYRRQRFGRAQTRVAAKRRLERAKKTVKRKTQLYKTPKAAFKPRQNLMKLRKGRNWLKQPRVRRGNMTGRTPIRKPPLKLAKMTGRKVKRPIKRKRIGRRRIFAGLKRNYKAKRGPRVTLNRRVNSKKVPRTLPVKTLRALENIPHIIRIPKGVRVIRI